MSAKRKFPTKLGQPVVQESAKVVGNGNLDESRTVVSGGGYANKSNTNGAREVVDISSDSSSDEEEEGSKDDNESAEEDEATGADVIMEDTESIAEDPIPEDVEESAEPSFGDLVRATVSEPIDVAGAFDDPSSRTLIPQGSQLQPPSGASLGTVLTQALKTNDISLLESCLQTTDFNTIRATIQRLDSPLAGTLLQKLAERLHRRPGRAGSLMVWVQWTLVTHGGYLATQRDLIKKLAELNRVIDTRSKGLQSLLSLKGKLDMLEAQIELRRSLQNQRRLDEEEEDDGVIYVEGQESDEEIVQNGNLEDFSDIDSEASDDMPTTNGIIADSDDEGGSSEDDDLIDDEAEETDENSADEDEVDHDDQDSQVEDDESDDGAQAPPSKMQRIGGLFSRKI